MSWVLENKWKKVVKLHCGQFGRSEGYRWTPHNSHPSALSHVVHISSGQAMGWWSHTRSPRRGSIIGSRNEGEGGSRQRDRVSPGAGAWPLHPYTTSSLCIWLVQVVWETQRQILVSGWFKIPATHSIYTELANPVFPF